MSVYLFQKRNGNEMAQCKSNGPEEAMLGTGLALQSVD